MSLEARNIPELLQQRSAHAPDKIFLLSEADGRKFTYREFEGVVGRVAGMLAANGVGKGDVVSLLLPNSVEYVIAYFACWRLGALAGPINSLLKEQEIAYVIRDSEAKVLLVNSSFLSVLENTDIQVIPFDNVEEFADQQPGKTRIDKNDEAIIIYTSGTTGKPKGCLLTHGNVIANARQ